MIPLHLRISGFLSYREPVDIDFTGLDLACISGPNGAGKSSLLDAITWVLFGIARKKDDSIINSACSSAEVVYTFAYESNVYRIQRSRPKEKTGLLDFFVNADPEAYLHNPDGENPGGAWRPLTEHSIRETEASIRNTLRMDYETFTNASFFLQGKADQFATQPAGDRKRILSSILGLEVWETYRQDAAERRKTLETECTTLDGRLREISAELAEEEDRKSHLQDLKDRLAKQSQARLNQEKTLESLRLLKQTLDRQRELVEKQKLAVPGNTIPPAAGRTDPYQPAGRAPRFPGADQPGRCHRCRLPGLANRPRRTGSPGCGLRPLQRAGERAQPAFNGN